jgi:transposase InsO family protein
LTKQPPNTLWCADFKGEFKLGNGRYCYPLTVSDHASRYLLLCEAFESTREVPVIEAFQRLFRDRGLPVAIRSARTRMFPGMTATSWSPLAADRVAQLALYPPPVRPAFAVHAPGFSISARISSTRHAVMRGPV